VMSKKTAESRVDKPAIFAVVLQRALGFAGRAAGVVERGDIVGAGEAARRGAACRFDRLQEIRAVVGTAEGEDGLQPRGFGGEFAATVTEGDAVDDKHLRFGIFQLKQ